MTNVFDSPVGFHRPSNYSDSVDLEGLTTEELLLLRSRIDEKLPATALKDLNLQEEAVIQFLVVKALQEKVMADESVPANQKAQVANACAATLQQLDRVQKETYTFERFKEIEHILAETMNDWPAEMSKKFFVEYERRLGVTEQEVRDDSTR